MNERSRASWIRFNDQPPVRSEKHGKRWMRFNERVFPTRWVADGEIRGGRIVPGDSPGPLKRVSGLGRVPAQIVKLAAEHMRGATIRVKLDSSIELPQGIREAASLEIHGAERRVQLGRCGGQGARRSDPTLASNRRMPASHSSRPRAIAAKAANTSVRSSPYSPSSASTNVMSAAEKASFFCARAVSCAATSNASTSHHTCGCRPRCVLLARIGSAACSEGIMLRGWLPRAL